MGIVGFLLVIVSYPLGNFLSPEVLTPREWLMGVGIAGPYPFRSGEVAIFGRLSIAPNLEAGGKFFLPPGFAADIKATVSTKPIVTALAIGLFSYWGWGQNSDYGYGASAQLLAGGRHVYGGLKALYWVTRRSAIETHFLPVIFIGASFGNKFRLTPEAGLAFGSTPSGEVGRGIALIVGLGYQDFNKK